MSTFSKKVVELEGFMLLEGPFLEQIIAAYLLKRGESIVPRLETGGIQHDILVEKGKGYVIYECIG